MLIDENGVFTEEFKGQLPDKLGDSFKDSDGNPTKFFDDKRDIFSIAKVALDTKRAYDKKLENVIQRPSKDAKPDDVKAFHKSLLKELGGIEKEDDLKDINFRAGVRDGVAIDDNMIAALKKFAASKGYPKSFVKEIVEEFYNPVIMTAYDAQEKAIKEAEKKAANEAKILRESRIKDINDTLTGDKLPESLRGVLKILEFMGDDKAKAKYKEAKLYDNPNIEAFEKAGIPIENILPFAKLATVIDTAKLVGSSSVSAPDPNSFEARLAQAKKDYPDAPHMHPKQ